MFTVKSVYFLHKDLETKLSRESSSRNLHSDVCKSIWRLKVANKVKMFIWRACSNAVPTFENLWRRKVIKEAHYPIYKLFQKLLSMFYGLVQ